MVLTPPAGTTTVTLSTINTNPVLTATTTVNIVATDRRVWTIVGQPANVQTGTQAQLRVQLQYITSANVSIYTTNGTLVANVYAPWTNTLNYTVLQNVTFSYTTTTTGGFYFTVMNGNMTLTSATFNVTAAPVPPPTPVPPPSQSFIGYYPDSTVTLTRG